MFCFEVLLEFLERSEATLSLSRDSDLIGCLWVVPSSLVFKTFRCDSNVFVIHWRKGGGGQRNLRTTSKSI